MKTDLITYINPKAPESEMFKQLRTNLQFMNNSNSLQTLLVTSTEPGEGKSWTSSNLGVTFAQAGQRVVIIDGDMRRGTQHSIFRIPQRPGLSNYLSGIVENTDGKDKDDLSLFVQETEIENLFVLPLGDVPPNPSELLVSDKMRKLINELKKICDIIIIDAPASLVVADANILASIADSTIIVVAHNQTKFENLEKVKKSIEKVGGKIAGVVYNKVTVDQKKYSNSYYYGTTVEMTTTTRKHGIPSKKEMQEMEKEERRRENKNRMANMLDNDKKQIIIEENKLEENKLEDKKIKENNLEDNQPRDNEFIYNDFSNEVNEYIKKEENK